MQPRLGLLHPHPTAATPAGARATPWRVSGGTTVRPSGFRVRSRPWRHIWSPDSPTVTVRPPVASRTAAFRRRPIVSGSPNSSSAARHVEEGFVEAQRLDLGGELGEHAHDRGGNLLVALEARRHHERARAEPACRDHRHGAADPVGPGFVACREHDAAGARRAHEQRLAPQGRVVELLDRRIEGVHVGMGDDPRPGSLDANSCQPILDQQAADFLRLKSNGPCPDAGVACGT